MPPARDHKQEDLGPSSPIPDKLYFKIGEVAKLVGVQAHVLRYWQSEIPAIRPSKSVSNQRRYRYKDVEVFREIRRLLYEERYTLAGARRRVLSREAPGALEAEGAGADDTADAAPEAAQAPRPAAEADAVAESSARAEVVPLVPPAPRAPVEDALDDELIGRLRRGLKDLVRLAGEEP